LLLAYVALFVLLAISPYDRKVWLVENIPTVVIVLVLVFAGRYYIFSPLSYILMFAFIVVHTVGGHYTFERVPFDMVTNLFGFARNNYDRLAHFSVGLYAYPIAELLLAKKMVNSKVVLFLFPVFTILSVACLYEIFEWLYAVSADAKAGIAVLGSQGDIWDAQKDMLSDGLGAVAVTILFWILNKKKITQEVV
jgi:putative membrane protein